MSVPFKAFVATDGASILKEDFSVIAGKDTLWMVKDMTA